MNDGPWNSRGNVVILYPYDGITKPTMVNLDYINIWLQIHDVSDLYAHLVKEICPRGNNKVVIYISLYHDKCLLFMLELF